MPKLTTLHATPEAVEQAFYDALEAGDVDALMSVWSEDDEIICIHPGGQRLQQLTRGIVVGIHLRDDQPAEPLPAGRLSVARAPTGRRLDKGPAPPRSGRDGLGETERMQ